MTATDLEKGNEFLHPRTNERITAVDVMQKIVGEFLYVRIEYMHSAHVGIPGNIASLLIVPGDDVLKPADEEVHIDAGIENVSTLSYSVRTDA
jgi:hypothetical protein